jgi:hypothetical protein
MAEPAAEAEADVDEAVVKRCNMVGGACYEAKRLARDLAGVTASVKRDADTFYEDLGIESREGMDYVFFFFQPFPSILSLTILSLTIPFPSTI